MAWSMVFVHVPALCLMVFQWFSMVANHWSSDGMVTLARPVWQNPICRVTPGNFALGNIAFGNIEIPGVGFFKLRSDSSSPLSSSPRSFGDFTFTPWTKRIQRYRVPFAPLFGEFESILIKI